MTVWLFLSVSWAQSPATVPALHGVEVQSAQGVDRVILHFSEAVPYKAFALQNPPRIVVDFPSLTLRASSGLPAGYAGEVLANIRLAQFNPTTHRMVLDLVQPARLDEVSLRNEGGTVPFRMAFDVVTGNYQEGNKERLVKGTTPAMVQQPATGGDWGELAERMSQPKPIPADLPFKTIPVPEFRPAAARIPVVVIDAGHGGRDPGAIGARGTHEKNVTLTYARALRDALLQTGRYKVELTRDRDEYIMLRDRLAFARKVKGDIFISVHADSAENPNTRGFSIYTLSDTASDKEAAALAARENKVDIIYGMNLSGERPDVTEILIDLAQRETRNKSSRLADTLVKAVGRKVTLLPNTHRHAGFAVLKAPDVPSVLIEIGFLSNRRDEALITSANYRREVIAALVQGVDNYFAEQKTRE